jgi:hypothetical protein
VDQRRRISHQYAEMLLLQGICCRKKMNSITSSDTKMEMPVQLSAVAMPHTSILLYLVLDRNPQPFPLYNSNRI